MGRAGEAVAPDAPPWLGALMVLAAAALWGTLGLFGRALYRSGLTPIELASVRAAIGALGLAIWFFARPAAIRIPWRDLAFFALYGLISIAAFQYLYFATIQRTTLAVAAALLYTAPAFVVLLAWPLARERPTRFRIAALAAVLAGMFLVTGAARTAFGLGTSVSAGAAAFGLGAGLTYGLYTVFGKLALRRYDPLRTVFFAFAFGALFLALAAPPWRPILQHPGALPTLIALGLFPTLAAYLLYIAGLQRLPAGTASMLATVEPVVATLLGALLLGEVLRVEQAAGIALIVGAAAFLARRDTTASAPLPTIRRTGS